MIRLFRMKINDFTETVLFSVGLSVASLIIIGIFVNEIFFIFNVPRPLSLTPLLFTLNIFVSTCMIIACLRDKNGTWRINLSLKQIFVSSFLLCVPTLSVIGAMMSGAYEDNTVLLFTLMIIASIFVILTISRKTFFTKLYPFVVFIIAVSLICHSILISDELIHFGSDVPGEVFTQKIVEKNAYWNPINPYPGDQSVGRTYAMLSVTLLPTIYSILLNMNSLLVFKLLFSILFAFVPLGLFNLWKNFVGEKFAFISAFFFMSFQSFYSELLGLNKQMLGELFLVLLLTLILKGEKGRNKKTIGYLIFSFALVVSHYALAEIFLFFILSVLIIWIVLRKQSKCITLSLVLYFFVIMFVWYLFTSSSSVYDSFLTFGERVHNELGDFFNLQSREPEILRGLGLEKPPTVWNLISRVFAYLTEAFIVIGFISLILKRSKIYLNKEYFTFNVISMFFLGALIAIPGLSSTMNMTRFYHVLLFFIAPLCVIGAESIIEFLAKHKDLLKTTILLLIVLVPYFLFQTGFIYELTDSPSWSVSLSKHRTSQADLYRRFGYIDAYCISGAEWLSYSISLRHTSIYADEWARRNELRAYGVIYVGYVELLSNVTQVKKRDIVYLNPSNTIEGTIIRGKYKWNITDLQSIRDCYKIYSNGGSEIYKKDE